ncbi:MAG TPA: tRNA-dihydrouridine synthase, partial [Leptospiraceae bacterium]|nr:tRNA-dihydrouridine synthase [Leptospiraceae bacterium]
MMEVTDRHFRRMLRFLSRDAHLYTEMVHSRAVLADARRYLAHMSAEYPLVLQLGGDDPME